MAHPTHVRSYEAAHDEAREAVRDQQRRAAEEQSSREHVRAGALLLVALVVLLQAVTVALANSVPWESYALPSEPVLWVFVGAFVGLAVAGWWVVKLSHRRRADELAGRGEESLVLRFASCASCGRLTDFVDGAGVTGCSACGATLAPNAAMMSAALERARTDEWVARCARFAAARTATVQALDSWPTEASKPSAWSSHAAALLGFSEDAAAHGVGSVLAVKAWLDAHWAGDFGCVDEDWTSSSDSLTAALLLDGTPALLRISGHWDYLSMVCLVAVVGPEMPSQRLPCEWGSAWWRGGGVVTELVHQATPLTKAHMLAALRETLALARRCSTRR